MPSVCATCGSADLVGSPTGRTCAGCGAGGFEDCATCGRKHVACEHLDAALTARCFTPSRWQSAPDARWHDRLTPLDPRVAALRTADRLDDESAWWGRQGNQKKRRLLHAEAESIRARWP